MKRHFRKTLPQSLLEPDRLSFPQQNHLFLTMRASQITIFAFSLFSALGVAMPTPLYDGSAERPPGTTVQSQRHEARANKADPNLHGLVVRAPGEGSRSRSRSPAAAGAWAQWD